MDDKTSGWELDEDKDIYIVSKYLPTNHLFIKKQNMVTLQWKSLAASTLTK